MIIDRFEGNFAVVELDNGNFENLPITLLPENAKEGDCIIICIDKHTNTKTKDRIIKKINKLFID